jgi:hypothetical protein
MSFLLDTTNALLTQILDVLREIRDVVVPPDEQSTLLLVVTLPNGQVLKGNHMAIVITDIQSVPLSLVKMIPDPTQGGHTVEAPLTGPVVWSSSAPQFLSVTPSADTFTAVAAATGQNGVWTINAAADGLSADLEVTVVDSEVASLTIIPGTPTP